MVYYYVYIIKFEDGRFYIGSRQSKVPASKDVKYWGSPVTYKHLWEDASLSKTKHILKVCDSFEEMRDMESKFIKDAWKKYPDLCLNRVSVPIFHPDISKAAAPLGGQKSYEMGVGIHAIPKEERSKMMKEVASRPEIKKMKKAIGKKCAELGLGVHSEEYRNSPEHKEMLSQKGKKLYEEGKGIFSLTPEEKSKYSAIGSKKVGDANVKLGRGIHRPDLQHKRKEWAKKGGQTSHKKFKFISPEGKIYEVTNYNQWCRSKGFSSNGFAKIICGRNKTTHGGWRLG